MIFQTRYFLREMGYKDKPISTFVDFAFMISFGTLRLGVGSLLIYLYMTSPQVDFLGGLAACVIYTIGWLFMYSIVSYGLYQMRRRKEAKLEQSSHPSNGLCTDGHNCPPPNGHAKGLTDAKMTKAE